MTKERENMLKLITNEKLEEKQEPVVEDKVYQSNPMKSDLYSKLSAFRKSQKKFTIQDMIKDSLK